MDVGDVTDPNLDGDFQTLVEVRQKRNNRARNETTIQHLLGLNEIIDTLSEDSGNGSVSDSPASATASTKKQTNAVLAVSVDADLLRTQLLDAVTKNDVSALKTASKKVTDAGLSLTDSALRDPQNNATVLHRSLIEKKWDVGKYLIQSNKDGKLLDDVFNVTVRKLSSDKTCLHILAENGQYDLTKLIIDQFTSATRRAAFLNAVVLTEVEGQRPRHLASIHLASLKGYTAIVALFLDSGVDVNCTNNKNDTPVLWAARGNHAETVRLLISRGADLQLENDKGSTPLYWAIRYGFSELTRLLVTEGRANVHQRRKLGLVTPIVLASALGHRDIVDVLLDNGADVEARIGNGTTALHAAAYEGNDDVIELLLTKGHALVDQTDTAGNTALLCAAKVGNVATMNQLVLHGASIDAQNKLGETIWHYAIRQDDDTLLKAIAGLYRKSKVLEPGTRTIKFAAGRNPLQVAVAAGRVDKIRCLLQAGADPKSTDLNGNTFYHLAARDGRVEVVKSFIDEVDLASVNSDGDTPLHLAAKSGNTEVVKLLLNKSKLDARDKLGLTPLHEAVGSEAAAPEVIRIMIDVIVKANNWSLVDAVDGTGNTALHVAARRGRPDILPEMAALNARARNHDGDTPFHLSARSGHPHSVETMLQVFNRPEKGFNVDEMTSVDGQSALHICAARGDWQRVELLVSVGADLSLQDNKGNTPLHIVVEESIKEPSMIESFLQVIRVVGRCATRWWCTANDRQLPTDESELYYAEMRAAMIHLTSEVFNADGLNVIGLATLRGSVPIIEEILNTPNVYRFRERDAILYDVTYLTPYTTPKAFAKSKSKLPRHESSLTRIVGKKSSSIVGVLENPKLAGKAAVDVGKTVVVATASAVVGPTTVSCLELIVSIPDEILAARVLEIAPYRQLVRNQWSGYQWIYVLLMLIHIVYMSLYSVYAMPYSSTLLAVYNVSSSSCPSFPASPELYGLFLIWPGIILVFMIYYTLSNLVRYIIKFRLCSPAKNTRCTPLTNFRFIELPFQILSFIFNYLDQLSALAFGALIIAWYVLYRCGTTSQVYVQVSALVFIVGWMFSLNFTKGFEAMHSFSVMLKFIIIRDITRFLFMYVFVLLGFGLAFQSLFQLSPTLASEYGTVWNTLFTVFNLMIGLGSPLDSSFSSTYSSAGGNSTFVYLVYIFYIAVASIIMMNLLVAMMSDTFANIKSNEGTTWKVGSLQLGLRIERSFPVLQKLLRCSGRDPVFFDSVAGRWMMSVPSSAVASRFGEAASKEETIDAMLKAIQRLEAKVDRVQVAQGELTQQVDAVTDVVRKGGDSAGLGAAVPLVVARKPPISLFNAAMMVRERPKSAAKGQAIRRTRLPTDSPGGAGGS